MGKIIKEYLHFTKRERTAVIILAILVLLFMLLPRMIPDTATEVELLTASGLRQSDSLHAGSSYSAAPGSFRNTAEAPEYSGGSPYHEEPVNRPGSLFAFDPNTLPAAGWKKLGLPDKTILTLQHYLERGGVFRKAADLGKIYGLHKDQLNRLLPYVRIKQAGPVQAEKREWYTGGRQSAPVYTQPERHAYPLIDINTADTAAFISLPGIGSRLANRIVRFREKLGGFYCIEQLSETFGLPDSVFRLIQPRLSVSLSGVHKINLNAIEADALKEHPYFRWNVANAIIAYRRQHGNFTNPQELLQIAVIDPGQLKKMTPYLILE